MAEPFKNLISSKTCRLYFDALSTLVESTPAQSSLWLTELPTQLAALELRARVQAMANLLQQSAPKNMAQLGLPLLRELQKRGAAGFDYWPFADWVERYGVEDWESAFECMRAVTQLFTAEFAVRPYLQTDLPRALLQLKTAARSPNEHLRRWASEGLRPRLPWGIRLNALIQNPQPSFELLEQIRFDPSLYVRKSVANHLNDISKDHPDPVIQTLKRWERDCPTSYQKEFRFILHRALRTLAKRGHPQALSLLGFHAKQAAHARIHGFSLTPKQVRAGDSIQWEVTITNTKQNPVSLMVDYRIGFQLKNKKTGYKVFKGAVFKLKPLESKPWSKKHSFKPITTRTYYAGAHTLALMVNGAVRKKATFTLLPAHHAPKPKARRKSVRKQAAL